jgi:hypothetical protein
MSLQLDTMKVGVLTGVNINPKRRLYGSSHRRIGINGTYDVLLGDFPKATNQFIGGTTNLANDTIKEARLSDHASDWLKLRQIEDK